MKASKFSKKDQQILTKSLSLLENDKLKDIVGVTGGIGGSFSRSTWERISDTSTTVLV